MKRFLCIPLLLFFMSIALSQTSRDVVYLKNGSIVKGKITEMNPSENLKIQTSDGSLFVYSINDILKTEKEDFVGEQTNENATTNAVSQEALESYFRNYLTAKPALKLIGVVKKNGIKREIYGQKIYEIEYELILDTKEDIYVSASQFTASTSGADFNKDFSYSKSDAQGTMDSYLRGPLNKISKGSRITANGVINFEETDNGWRAAQFSNKNYKTVSSNYLPTEIINREKEIIQEKMKQLDWSYPDTNLTEFSPLYLKSENIPLFSYGNTVYTFGKPNLSNERNDVINKTQDAVAVALSNTNRDELSDESSHTTSLNHANVVFSISKVDFTFKETGYQCSIHISAKVNGNYAHPFSYSPNFTNTISAKSSMYNKSMNKDKAFNSALDDLKIEIKRFVFRTFPIQTEVISMSNGKKGKVDYVTLKKPQQTISFKNVEFKISLESGITVNNNKINLGHISECTSKEIDNEIIQCKVSGKKNKEALQPFINDTKNLVAITSF